MFITGQRSELQDILEEILGSSNVYFQPPSNVQMQYPCIVYKRDTADTKFAANYPYSTTLRYQVIYISRSPDSEVLSKLMGLPRCLYDRSYVVDNLNHDSLNVYF